jgi:hypothetical protein
MPEDPKSYFLLTGMSSHFRLFEDKLKKENREMSDDEYRMWNLRCQLAQAQQLSMISTALGKIVGFTLKDQPTH